MGQPQSQAKGAGLRPEGSQAQIKGPVGPGLHPAARAAPEGRLSQARGKLPLPRWALGAGRGGTSRAGEKRTQGLIAGGGGRMC